MLTADMDFRVRLMLFWAGLREPTRKPPVNEELDARLDKVDKRLDRLDARDKAVGEAYDRGDVALHRR